ncbi:hypothetical protein [Methylocystis bryophila]|uniref:TonB C-terminal domain-containing protein n=1 Tax=Methylocystis bryophila TaxID=655015 RepID=A0A1W6MST9_9HYPH|nr:hypothetical protein [Methylocystis bryophila]ARN80693.1 hypothetical protein B1812_05950 [Methylocystis bryophila]BDV40759.1 hypothetical protein DSM21852_40120 [Methylocystis bryophila]
MSARFVWRATASVYLQLLAVAALSASAKAQPAEGQPNSAYASEVSQIIRARMPLVNPYANTPAPCPTKREWAYPLATVEVQTCSASCSFRIGSDGRAHVTSCRADVSELAAILREAVVGASFPPPPGGRFVGEQSVRFHGKGRNPAFP